jgi:DNA-binding MarR family transcriptional regulator
MVAAAFQGRGPMRRFFHLESGNLDIENRVSYRLFLLARRMQRNLAAVVRTEYHLPLIAWQVISNIARLGPMSAKDVTLRTELPPDQVSRIIDLLVRRGWLARRRNPDDRRQLSLLLRAPGERVYAHIEKFVRAMNYEVMRGFTAAERREFERLMNKLESRSRAVLDHKDSWRGLLAAAKTR